MHCDLIQGYVISPPLPAQDFASRFLHIEQRVAV
jgi:EAL domain-containing protein (putative c-di-GMP-specific phosphodiesterase class I)